MDLDVLKNFVGWMSVLNLGFLLFTTLMFVMFKPTVMILHRKFFNLTVEQFNLVYFCFLAIYKLLTLVFCVVPYFALVIISA